MIKNYFKVAWRSLVRSKGYSSINIGGLAVGMSVAILIGLWIYEEFSFNKYFRNYDRIAQVMQNQTYNGEVQTWRDQAMQLAPELRNSYKSNFRYIVMSSNTKSSTLSFGEKKLTQTGFYMEPEAPDMLTLQMLKGSRAGLKDPNSVLLCKSVAKALFDDVDPIDKIIKIDTKLLVKVTGVYEDLPNNSTFAKLNFIAPWQLLVQSENLEQRVTWGNSWFQTFVQVADHADMNKVSAIIRNAKLNKVDKEETKYNPQLFLLPMKRWHLYSEFKNGINTGGSIKYVWLFGVIGGFVLLLACINFTNLSTARSEKRAKEVGVRKTIGSSRSQLMKQFFTESFLVVSIAFILSLLFVQLGLPFFNEVSGKKISVAWTEPLFWLAGVGFIFITALTAGSYPAFYLSSFQPVKVLKGTFRVGRFAAVPRKVLVVVQFAVSVVLIICTIIVIRQIQFAKSRPIGFSRDGLLSIPINSDDIKKHYTTLRNELIKTGAVEEMAQSESRVINGGPTNSGLRWRGKDPNLQDAFLTIATTAEYGKTLGWTIKEGRDFSKEFASDSSAFILNEAAVKYMNLKNPLGETVNAFGRTYTVIGVVKDMVMRSSYEPVKQTIFYIDKFDRVNYFNIKINPKISAGAALALIEPVFKKFDPENPFEYKFADDDFNAKFINEERVAKLAGFFAILAIFISCLGLLGLASFVAEQRTKEIGIRKVLGATVLNVWHLLSKDFVSLVIISLLVSVPISYYFMHNWLQNYEYRTEMSWWIFVAAGGGALSITLLTISFQAIKAAIANPIKSLRTE